MPELPEVELAATHLRTAWLGVRIAEVWLELPCRAPALEGLKRVEGAALLNVRRHGKQLALDFEGSLTLLLHLGMTGRFETCADGRLPPHTRFALVAQTGTVVAFRDPRRFARSVLCSTVEADRQPAWQRLGPDALAADIEEWVIALRTASPLKPTLLDQHRIAGVGNIYASEALWLAGLDPRATASTLTGQEIARLRTAVQAAMWETLRREGDTTMRYLSDGGLENPFQVYGRAGEPCPRCARPILRITQAGRSTWYCAACQPARSGDPDPARSRGATFRRGCPAP